ncbi:hypothetical protein, partial [Aeromonas sp. QDB07]|uniref:hypothetical protein n=1 Tax=Aeromonas sp. QDB07 TaxID=2989838 RepID=UPI0022DF8E73
WCVWRQPVYQHPVCQLPLPQDPAKNLTNCTAGTAGTGIPGAAASPAVSTGIELTGSGGGTSNTYTLTATVKGTTLAPLAANDSYRLSGNADANTGKVTWQTSCLNGTTTLEYCP